MVVEIELENGNRSCARILSGLLFLCTGDSEKGRLLNGITADLSVDLSDAGSSDFLDREMPTKLFDQVRALLDAKTLACDREYMGLIPEGACIAPRLVPNFLQKSARLRSQRATERWHANSTRSAMDRNREP